MSFNEAGRYPALAPAQALAERGRTPTLVEALRQQEMLRAVIESISAELALRPLLTRIARSACELLDAWDAGIGLYDPQRDVIRMEACYRLPDNELGAEFGPGKGLAGAVLEARRPLVFESYRDVPSPTRTDRRAFAVVGVPIAWGDRLIGFFGIGAQPPRRFDDGDVETLTLFARHAAIAIVNAQRYEREQRRSRRWALVARVGRLIASGLELRTLLRTAADAIHESLGYTNVAIPLVDPEDPSRLIIDVVGGRYREILEGTYYLPISTGIMGAAVRERAIQRVDDVESDPRYVPTPGSEGIRAELAVPILLGRDVLGVVNVESDEAFTEEDAESLQVIADHLGVAIANARLYARGRRLAALEERQRIARDLHDSVSQMLFSTSLLAESIIPTWHNDPAAGQALVEQVIARSRAAQVEMRALLEELQPAGPSVAGDAGDPSGDGGVGRKVRRDGLAVALLEHARELRADGLEVRVDDEGYARQPVIQEETLYHIAREALHNVVKHAEAAHAEVRLRTGARHIVLEVLDDGVGLPAAPAEPSPGSGFGLRGMALRASQLGGRCTIANRERGGAVVRVKLPLPSRR